MHGTAYSRAILSQPLVEIAVPGSNYGPGEFLEPPPSCLLGYAEAVEVNLRGEHLQAFDLKATRY